MAPNRLALSLGIERSFAEIAEDDLNDPHSMGSSRDRTSSSPLCWDDLLRSRRVLIISEAGSGKTYECRALQRRLWEEGQAAFMLELAVLATTNLTDQLDPGEERRLDRWRLAQSEVATFFLDSVDELNLTRGSFRLALTRLGRAVEGQLGRVRVIVTSRPVPFDRDLVRTILPVPPPPEHRLTETEFADIAMGRPKSEVGEAEPSPWRTVELLPLSDGQIMLFASREGVGDPEAFLEDLRRRNAVEFAERPHDLLERCAEWRERRQADGYRMQVAHAITTKLKPRDDRRELTELSPDKAYEGASRLALAAMLMRRLTFRHGPESDAGGQPGGAIDPADILPDWAMDERRTLLERSLFGFASYGRVRFHHRSVLEYLAAQRLAHYLATGKPIAGTKRLLFAETAQGNMVVRPAMRPAAAWLALGSETIFAEVLKRDPAVLMDFGDPAALPDSQKASALSAYVALFGSGGISRPSHREHTGPPSCLSGAGACHTQAVAECRERRGPRVAARSGGCRQTARVRRHRSRGRMLPGVSDARRRR